MRFVPLFEPPRPAPEPVVEPRIVYRDPPDIDDRLKAAREAGFTAGLAQAHAEADVERAALQAEVAVLPDLVSTLLLARQEALNAAAQDIAAIVSNLCARVLDSALADPAWLIPVIENILTRLPPEDEVTIYVPVAASAGVAQALSGKRGVHVLGDPSISAGCHVATHHAEVDAGLPVIAEGIDAALAEWLAARAGRMR
jgi:flagellar biosynthesis/type III secretory pathway protein FliH